MANDFKFDIKFNFAIPRLKDASIPLGQIADKIVLNSKRNIRQQLTVDGVPFVPLTKETIRRKKKSGSIRPTEALVNTGLMYNSIRWYKNSKNSFSVGVQATGNRDKIALIHQVIGIRSKRGNIIRPFLGVRETTSQWINDRMQRWANRALKDAVPKTVKMRKLI